jgi:hypothetical protein
MHGFRQDARWARGLFLSNRMNGVLPVNRHFHFTPFRLGLWRRYGHPEYGGL